MSTSHRINSRELQLERLTKILSTKAELDIMLQPRVLRRRGAIGVYTFLNGVRLGLLKNHFTFWRTAKHKQRRKLIEYFDKWNVWTSIHKLRKYTASRFIDILTRTSLVRRRRRAYRRLFR